MSHQFDEVLRLATHVVLLDGGRVAAQGDVASVSRDPALRSVLGPGATGAVVDAEVEPSTRRASRADRRGADRASGANRSRRRPVRLHLLARDVIVATEEPSGLVQASSLPGTIAALAPETPELRCSPRSTSAGHVCSRVRRRSRRELGLAVGSRVWVVVNAASLRGDLPAASS